MKRLLQRNKPKAHILENMSRQTFKDTKCDEVIVEMKPNKDTRSVKQNKLYWMWLGILTETGNSQGALHQYLAQEYLSPVVEEVNGKPILVIKSTDRKSVV